MTDRTDLPNLATRAEAAAALKVSVRTVDRLITRGKLAVVHPTPTAVRITAASINALVLPDSAPASPADVDAGAPIPHGAPALPGADQ